MIKVTKDHVDDFWTLEKKDDYDSRLSVYSIARKNFNEYAARRDVNISTTDGKLIGLLDSRLSYDGEMSIFLNDCRNRAVHTFSVNGLYRCKLLSSDYIRTYRYSLAVNKRRHLLYIGKEKGIVHVFNLTYEKGAN